MVLRCGRKGSNIAPVSFPRERRSPLILLYIQPPTLPHDIRTTMASTHRNNYLDRFPGFQRDPRRPLNEEFASLASFQQWRIGSKVYRREHIRFLCAEFDLHLGIVEQGRKLEDWQALCHELRVNPIPGSITQCKKVEVNTQHWQSGTC